MLAHRCPAKAHPRCPEEGAMENRPSYTTMIRDLPRTERPRERLRQYGASYLSNAELLAILLRTGVSGENVINLASRLLSRFRGLPGLARASSTELSEERGVSEAKACQVMAAFELGRRMVSLLPEDRALIRSPQDVVNLLGAEMGTLDQEHFRVMLLNTRNEVLSVQELYVGNVHTAVVRVAEVLRPAVRENAPAIIIVHNHPSGDPDPSVPDVEITRDIRQGATLMSIDLVDHIVIGSGGRFASMKEMGMGF